MAVITGDEFRTPISIDDQASGALNKINASVNKSVGGFTKLQANVLTFNAAMGVARQAYAAFDKVFGSGIRNFAEFETAMVGVAKTVNLADDEIVSLGKAFQDLSEEIPSTAVELAGIGQTAGQLGVQGADQILKFTKTIAMLGTASDLSGEQGATALARILNVTEGGVENIDRLGASIVGLGNQFAATESEIARVATEVARSTSAFQIGSANTLGLSTALKSMGIQAQLGGSVVGKSFNVINDALRNGGAELKALEKITGQTGGQLRKTFAQDATKVFQQFIEGLGKMNPRAVTGELAKMKLEGDEVNKVLPVMATRADLVGKALSVANDEYEKNTALTEEARKANATMAAEWQKLLNVIKNVTTGFDGFLGPAITQLIVIFRTGLISVIKEVTTVTDAMAESFREMGGFTRIIQELGSEFANFGIILVAALAPLAAPAIASGLAVITTFVTATAIPAAILAVKFALIAAAIVTIAAAGDILLRNLDKIDQVVELFAAVFLKGLNLIRQGFAKLGFFGLGIISDMLAALGKIPKFAGIAADGMGLISKATENLADTVVELNAEGEELNGTIATAAKGLDLGFSGELISKGTQFLDKFNQKLAKTEKMAGNVGKSLGQKPGATPSGGGAVTPDTAGQTQLFDEKQISHITGALGETAGGMASAASSMLAVPLGMLTAADMILDAIQKLIDIIPNMLNKVAGIFDSLADLPLKITEAVGNIGTAVTKFVKTFLPNLFKSMFDVLDMLIGTFLEDMPKVFDKMIMGLSDQIAGIMDKLPELLQRFISGFISSGPKFISSFIKGFIKGIPIIWKAFIRGIGPMVNAIINGIIIGLKEAINAIANSLGFDDIFNLPDLEEKMETMGDNIQRSAAKLFEVIDLDAAARGLDLADKIRNAISSAGRQVVDWLQKLWDALLRLWQWVSDNILMPFINLLRSVWEWVWTKVLKPLLDGLQAVWQWVMDKVVHPIVNGLVSVWHWVLDKVVNPIVNGLRSVWDFVKVNIIDNLAKGFAWVTSLVNTVTSLFTTPTWLSSLSIPTPGWLQGFIDAVKDLTSFGGFSMGGLVSGSKQIAGKAASNYKKSDVGKATTAVGKVTGGGGSGGVSVGGKKYLSAGGVAYLAGGGSVPTGKTVDGTLYAAGGAKAIGTDTVPAMLTPGEFVVNREASRNNLGLLSFINGVKSPVSPVKSTNNISVIINAKTDLSAQQIRREVIPELERQLKRKSQEGAFMLANTGLRSNK